MQNVSQVMNTQVPMQVVGQPQGGQVQPAIAQPHPQPSATSNSQQPVVNHNGIYMPVNIPQSEPGKQPSNVNIIIYNPSVNPSAGTVANSNNTYSTPAVYPYPVSGVNANAGRITGNGGENAAAAAVNLNGIGGGNPNQQMAYPANYYTQGPKKANADDVAKSYIANTSVKDTVKTEEAKKEKETHKEKIVQLTDEYIMTLENYMNNPNAKVREMAIKEVMERFKEHKSRFTDVALTNLLNKALQDRSKAVRFVALATLDSEFARGDDFTVQLLNNMQSSSAVYGEDALMAADILLKMSRRQVEVTVPGPKPESKKVEK